VTQEHRKLFTLDEALELLPVVRRLLEELQESKRDLQASTERIDRVAETTTGNGHFEHGPSEPQTEAQRRATELQKLIEELDDLGVELKGIDQGLVDFPSLREGRVVYLCYRLGEETISWWHDLDAGFAGRQPL
jgi:hypothetical protein